MSYCKTFCSIGELFALLEYILIKCNLPILMGKKKISQTELAKETGIHRGTIARLYHETALRIDFDVMDELCDYFDCEPGDIFIRDKSKSS